MSKGFLVVDKPSDVTSTHVVNQVKKATGVRKVGHAGTLDPMATGAMVLALGKVTRLIRFIQDQPKEYEAVAQFGVATDTLDADGSVLNRQPMEVEPADLESVVPRFLGRIHQVPPMVSALKSGGRRLHELAREGVVVERDARPVQIHELEIISVGPGPYPEVGFRVVCGKGTYVRSLADDIATVLGGFAHLRSLRRKRIGTLQASEGVRLDELPGWRSHLLTPAEGLRDLPAVTVGEATAKGVRHGMRFLGGELSKAPEGEPCRVLDDTGGLLAVYVWDGSQAFPEVVLPE
ncbi:MAG: tRNA pseudouridine(55) synthase TruB [Acidimicrobiia bacterium]|nr:tRNA pseudouridine(55) synthase TruB [Acidimicrobiia bacterium]